MYYAIPLHREMENAADFVFPNNRAGKRDPLHVRAQRPASKLREMKRKRRKCQIKKLVPLDAPATETGGFSHNALRSLPSIFQNTSDASENDDVISFRVKYPSVLSPIHSARRHFHSTGWSTGCPFSTQPRDNVGIMTDLFEAVLRKYRTLRIRTFRRIKCRKCE